MDKLIRHVLYTLNCREKISYVGSTIDIRKRVAGLVQNRLKGVQIRDYACDLN